MIRSLQLRVNTRTKEFNLARDPKAEDLTPTKKEQVQHIAKKQASVEELTRTMSEKLSREAD